MKLLMTTIFSSALVLTGAMQPVAAANDLDTVKDTLGKLMPKATPDSVMESAIPGIYEAVFGANVIYVSGDGRYMVEGDLYDLQKRENLTENKRETGRMKAIGSIPHDTMIIFKPEDGKTKYVITAFTDIDCGYCRKLHEQIADYNKLGIEVHYLAYPRAGLNSASYYKAESVWCATNQQKAMTFAKSGAKLEQIKALEQVKDKDCKPIIREHMDVAKEVGVSGTPTLVMNNGKVLPGYVAPDRLIQYLDKEVAN